ncbi:hypothetical protein TWF694_005784 [Orbilia ellipsospora]|uniref:guanylate kinase n=1 Tax=Orbilia ellipsospora TaxID=2528407 RepID=A0AAV9WSZ4_9PEZI
MSTAVDLRPIVICGPSGVGKGTLCTKLKSSNPIFKPSISHTTRAPRPDEVNGKHYHFTTSSAFSTLLSQNAFLETTNYNGENYGTSKQTILDQSADNAIVVLDIDIEGAKQLKKTDIQARYVFIKPPSFEALEERLRGRGSEKEEDVRRRLERAVVELEYADVPGAFDKVIVNDDLEVAFTELVEFVGVYQTVDAEGVPVSQTS